MGVEDVIDTFIDLGGEGAYPSLMVTRQGLSVPSGGIVTPAAKTYFFIRASIRPGKKGADLQSEQDSMYVLEERTLYTKSAELWVLLPNGGPLGAGHDADVVTLYPIAAQLALSSFCTHADSVVGSVIVGLDGNAVTLELIGDAVAAAGVLDETAWPAIKFHFEPSVTAVSDFETAIAGGTKLAIATPGTPGNLFVSDDARGPVALAGGNGETWRVRVCRRYRGFWKATIERMELP